MFAETSSKSLIVKRSETWVYLLYFFIIKRLYVIENVWYDIVSFVCISRTSHKTLIILSHLFVCILPCSLITLTVAIDISFRDIKGLKSRLQFFCQAILPQLYQWNTDAISKRCCVLNQFRYNRRICWVWLNRISLYFIDRYKAIWYLKALFNLMICLF